MAPEPTGYCMDCGKELPATTRTRSIRCLDCHGRWLANEALDEYAEFDRQILDAVAKTRVAVLAEKWGLTRAAVYHRVVVAKRREAARKARSEEAVA